MVPSPADHDDHVAYLREAVARTLAIADDVNGRLPGVGGLASCAGYLLRRDPNGRRLARAATLNALYRTLPEAIASCPVAARAVVADALVPAAATVIEVLAADERVPVEAVARVRDDLERYVYSSYDARSADVTWFAMQALQRLITAQADIAGASIDSAHSPLLDEVRSNAVGNLDRHIIALCRAIADAMENGSPVDKFPASELNDRPLRHEAIADSLLNPAARQLSAALHADGFFAKHVDAVSAVLGDVKLRPTLVLGDNLWFREMRRSRGDARGVHIRGVAILLAKEVGAAIVQQRELGRLNATLVHELVHATQRNRHGPLRKPPYNARAMYVERKFLEGMTQYFTRRILGAARARWPGAGENPYSAAEDRLGVYFGYSFVAMATVQAAHPSGVPVDLLVEYSYNPHKLTRLTEALTGSWSVEKKQALVETLEGLFAMAESLQGEPNRIESEIPKACRAALDNLRERYAPDAAA